ncbi:Cna protein B-type domain protein [Planctomycetes bacterium CA13]|uniref:Cna protein B-type domain protein n=2 Tax=Novipirellula herctigrandis TaxID=2527986 RepID=A0A5C5Z7K0_9BACT|nr:Cna protein B-type domain protein [Planctomycetes bacterium CA13]
MLISVTGSIALADSTRVQIETSEIKHRDAQSRGDSIELQLDVPVGQSRIALAGAKVTLVDSYGVAKKYVADSQGKVRFDDIVAGPYAVVAAGENVYGSTILFIQPQSRASLRMPLAAVNVKKLTPWMDKFTSQFSQKHANQLGHVMSQIERETSFSDQVQLREGGILKGQLVSILDPTSSNVSLAGTEVVLTQKGLAVGKTYTNEAGEFLFKGVRAGVHGVVAAGPAGYATFAFEAIEAAALANGHDPKHQLVSVMTNDIAWSLPVTLVPPTMIPGVVDPFGASMTQVPAMIGSENLVSADCCGHGNVGGSFSGGMGGMAGMGGSVGGGGIASGGGSGSIGGLGLLGGIAAAIAIPVATSNDDDTAGPVASPSGI